MNLSASEVSILRKYMEKNLYAEVEKAAGSVKFMAQ